MGTSPLFRDRVDAGRRLAERLGSYAGRDDVRVLALPRGGVAVGAEVARALGVPLGIMTVRKLGVPGHEELAMGAVASGGVRVLDPGVVGSLGISQDVIEEETRRERAELERRELAYRGGRAPEPVEGYTVILVDDGIATGSTVRAALAALRAQNPAAVVLAVPTAPASTCAALRGEADEVVCLATPEPFFAISLSYSDFPKLDDDEVRALLAAAAGPGEGPGR